MKKEDTTFACVAIIDYASAMTGFISKKEAYNGASKQATYLRALCAQNEDAIADAENAHDALTKMIEYADEAEKAAFRELKNAARVFLVMAERLGDALNVCAHADFIEQARCVTRKRA